MESLTEKESQYSLSQGFLIFPATGAISYPPTPPPTLLVGHAQLIPSLPTPPTPRIKEIKRDSEN